jgi:hypothetical protein
MSIVIKGGASQMISKLQRLAAGVEEYYPGKTLSLDGKPWKSADLVAFLRAQATALQDAAALGTSWRQAVAQNRTVFATQVTPMLSALKSYVANTLGSTSAGYTAMGYTAPKKPGPRGVKAKVVQVAKNLATRAARHTMGKKQREEITATPEAVNAMTASLLESTAPASTAPPAAPASQPVTTASTGAPNGANGSSHS